MSIRRAIPIVAIVLLTACGSPPGSPTTPSTPPPPPAPLPLPPRPAYQTLNGYAYDTAFSPVEGATISLLDGAQAGASTTSNESGRFTFAGSFEATTTVRVSKDGYTSTTGTAKSNGGPTGVVWAFVVLDRVATPVNISGDYTLTIVADIACTGIPDGVRTRSWPASISTTAETNTQPGTALTLTVSGGPFVPAHDRFSIGVSGGDVAFNVWAGEDFGLIEKIAPGTFLAIGGFGKTSIGTGPITRVSIPLAGTIDYCAMQSDSSWNYECNSSPRTAFEHCESTQHQLVLARR